MTFLGGGPKQSSGGHCISHPAPLLPLTYHLAEKSSAQLSCQRLSQVLIIRNGAPEAPPQAHQGDRDCRQTFVLNTRRLPHAGLLTAALCPLGADPSQGCCVCDGEGPGRGAGIRHTGLCNVSDLSDFCPCSLIQTCRMLAGL